MSKKAIIQLCLVSTIFLIFYYIFVSYFQNDSKNLSSENKKIKIEKIEVENLIKNISYSSRDDQGREYIIKAGSGEIDTNDDNIIFMSDVKAQIIFLDGTFIYVTSLKANYDSLNYNTEFFDDVNVFYEDHEFKSQNLIIDFDKNILEAFNDLSYKNLNTKMFADKIELNLVTKNSKIFNFDNSEVLLEITKE